MNTTCDRTVATYLQKVSMGDFTPVPSQNRDYTEKFIEVGDINLKIKGKIDMSQFDTPKQKFVRSDSKKEYIYH